jgi:glutamyl-tRNA reductase
MNHTNDIGQLFVAHWPKTGGYECAVANRALLLDTCLRQLHIDVAPIDKDHGAAEVRSGVDAYGFVLEVTTGLRSAVPGETNVFGQFKSAWQQFRREGPATDVARLAPIVHRLINDTKAIRNRHLQGIGGSSYGSLVRRLIAPSPGDRILFVGAGNLARSMWPLFRNFELALWNHHPVNVSAEEIERVFEPGSGREAAAWADHVILTTPPDQVNDRNWRAWLGASRVRTIVHLGQRRNDERVAWSNGVTAFDLDDVFALRNRQAGIRSLGLERARAACRHHAMQLIEVDHDLPLGTLKSA